jgi:hypothetical protein
MEVFLKCIRIGSKLRIRIISPNYHNNHNCRFPKNIRVDNRLYQVLSNDIKLISSRGKHYYNINIKNLKIIDDTLNNSLINKSIHKIFTNDDDNDDNKDICVVCLENQKYYVFGQCGHYYTCKLCSDKLKTCPICRSEIEFKIPYTSLNN